MKTALGAHSGFTGPHTRCVPGDFPFPSRVAVPMSTYYEIEDFFPAGLCNAYQEVGNPRTHTGKCLKLKIQTDWGQQPIFLVFQNIDLFIFGHARSSSLQAGATV